MRQIGLCRLHNIYYFPPKRVRILSTLSLSRHYSPIMSRCRDGHSYEPNMGSQGPYVHRASQLTRSSPRALECVPSSHFCFVIN